VFAGAEQEERLTMYIIGRHMEGIMLNPMEYVVDDEGYEIVFITKEGALAKINYETEEEADRDGLHLRRYEPCCKCKEPLNEPFPEENETGIYCDECKPEETIILDVPTITDSKELGHLIQERLDDYSKEPYSHLFTVGNLAESIAMDIIHSFNYDHKVSQKEKSTKEIENENSLRHKVKEALKDAMGRKSYECKDELNADSANLADAVFDALGINKYEQDYPASETTIRVIDSEKMVVEWCMADVMQQASDMKVEVTEKQAKDVLSLMDNKHDANIGICWDVIGCWIDHVLAEDKKEAEGAN
jgi:hypothetical protein